MKRYIFIIFLLLEAVGMWAAVTFRGAAPQSVETNEPFRITYTVNTDEASNFRPAVMRGLNVIAGPYTSQMQNYTNVNGKSSSISSITYTLTVMATTAGRYTIPPATIEANGQTIRSNSLQIQVVAGSGGKSANRSRTGRGTLSSSSSSTKVGKDDIFITAQVNRTKVYEQEAILLTYKLYSLVNIRGFNNVKLPDFKGFHSQEIPQPQTQTLQPENYRGRTYGAAIYRQFILFPQKSGKLTIPSAQFDAAIEQRVETDDLFEAMLNGAASRMVQKTLRTADITIDVYPLPASKPESFCGGVGTLSISSSLKSSDVKTGDAISLKITVSGTGNLKLITAPHVEFPKDFDVYDPKTSEDIKPSSNGMVGKKVFEYLAIPRNVGKYTIPAVAFSYFDTQTNSYKTITTQPFTLNVSKGKYNSSTHVRDYTDEVTTDIRYIKKGEIGESSSSVELWGSLIFWLAYLIPAAVFIILLTIYRKQAFENANIAYARVKKANKAAIRRLRTAEKLLKQKQYDAFYDEVIRALWGYVSDKLTIPTSELTKENIAYKLSQKGVGEETNSLFIRTLDDCEFAKYAPGDKNKAMDQTYSAAIRIITQLENEIKR